MVIEPQVALEIARFIASGPTPEQIIAFHPSVEATDRFYDLIALEKDGVLTKEERTELESCLNLEHMMRLVKVEAHRLMNRRAS